jgi:uncharacterized protein (DUF302 family)
MTGTSPSNTPSVSSRQSPYSVGETLTRLEQVISGRGLKQFARFDHSDEAAKVGLSMQPAHVLIFGSPKAGTPLMLVSPLIALELPLRVLVWQDQDAQVWVSYTEPSSLARRFEIPADLIRVLAAVEGVVDAALHGIQPQ